MPRGKRSINIESRAQTHLTRRFQIAKLIRFRRIELGLTQSALAERVGLTRTSIVQVERGAQMPSVLDLPEWLNALEFKDWNILGAMEKT
jgi:transcriptional regulator with XRE-family HTH domain